MFLAPCCLLCFLVLGQDIPIDLTKQEVKLFDPPRVHQVASGGPIGSSQPRKSVLLRAEAIEITSRRDLTATLSIVNVTNQSLLIPVTVTAPPVPPVSKDIHHYRILLIEFDGQGDGVGKIQPVELVSTKEEGGSFRALAPGATIRIKLRTSIAHATSPMRVSIRIAAIDVELSPSEKGYKRQNLFIPELTAVSESTPVRPTFPIRNE